MSTQNIPVSVMNAHILDSLDRDPMVKQAQEAATDYTRLQIREDSFAFKIQVPEKATDDMLDRTLDETCLQIIWEAEPDNPGSKWVPLQTIPDTEYIMGSRYSIPFARVLTPKFVKDIDELRTTRQDIRKILTENAIKDALAEIDSKWISTINSIVHDCDQYGVQNQSGKVQLWTTNEGLNRETFAEMLKLLPRGNEQGKFRLRNYCALMNEVTAKDLLKLKRNEVGGDYSEEMFKNGLTSDTLMGIKLLYTIKSDLVPDDHIYFFAAPEFMGKSFYLTDWTTYMKKEAYFIEMFSYWLGGFAIGNIASCALAKVNQSYSGWDNLEPVSAP